MLKDIKIKAVYNSEEDNILEDFYVPALSNSVSYDRAVGYFDAKMLTSSASGLAPFIENDGYMRLIVGATLTEDEYEAISRGYDKRTALEKLENNFIDIINSSDSDLFQHQLHALTWMITHRKLDVKIALRKNGIHHQKIGIFRDKCGDFVVFQGSANETNKALLPFNYETINVFKGWHSELEDHYLPHLKSFDKLWSNQAKDTLVIDFTDISLKVLSSKFPDVSRPSLVDEIDLWQKYINCRSLFEKKSSLPFIPVEINGQKFVLKDHQRTALQKWRDNKFHGLFELATGAGKTITAIYGAVKIFESRKKLFLVVSVPYQNLADQWEENLKLFNIKPLVCYGGENRWLSELTEKVLAFRSGITDFVAIVVVDATLSSKTGKFFDLLQSLDGDLKNYFLFIGDECHHHGAEAIASRLPQNASLRIGLSATPDRGEEDVGNDRITKFYGKVIHQYTLEDALNDKVLTPYEYHLIPVPLTIDETERYIDLSERISKVFAIIKGASGSGEQEERLNILLSQRARIVNGSINKPIALEKLLQNIPPIKHSLFYCAEGNIDLPDIDNSVEDIEATKQIEVVSQILHSYGWKSCHFTANENKARRNEILDDFKEGRIDSLVAMKCLDEGVDIPACSTAFILSSSRQPRQFVQRRGRILRRSPGKDLAVIYDFFTTLPLDQIEDITIARKLLMSELKRINEFAKLAKNKSEVYKSLEEYLKKFDLYHHIV